MTKVYYLHIYLQKIDSVSVDIMFHCFVLLQCSLRTRYEEVKRSSSADKTMQYYNTQTTVIVIQMRECEYEESQRDTII